MKASNHHLGRRTFVKAAAIVPFAAVRGTAANSAVSIGLIGSGGRGPRVCRLLVDNTPGRVTALCDLYDEKIERAKKTIGIDNPAVYKDYEKLLASDVDAVMISTPAFLHAEHFEKAVQAGKHIYIEKPAAPDVAGCKRIMRAARQCRPRAEHHLRLSAAVRADLSQSESVARLRRDRHDSPGDDPVSEKPGNTHAPRCG